MVALWRMRHSERCATALGDGPRVDERRLAGSCGRYRSARACNSLAEVRHATLRRPDARHCWRWVVARIERRGRRAHRKVEVAPGTKFAPAKGLLYLPARSTRLSRAVISFAPRMLV